MWRTAGHGDTGRDRSGPHRPADELAVLRMRQMHATSGQDRPRDDGGDPGKMAAGWPAPPDCPAPRDTGQELLANARTLTEELNLRLTDGGGGEKPGLVAANIQGKSLWRLRRHIGKQLTLKQCCRAEIIYFRLRLRNTELNLFRRCIVLSTISYSVRSVVSAPALVTLF